MSQKPASGHDVMHTGILLDTGTNELEILEFHINGSGGGADAESVRHSFGVNVAKVMEVIESPNLEPLPGAAHPSFRGIISLRGHILPVIDLAVWLGIDRVPSQFDNIIVTEFSQAVTGFVVSGVTGIHRVGWPEVIPPDSCMPKEGVQAIIGLVERDEHFIQLLDLESIIADLSPEHQVHAAGGLAVAPRAYSVLAADDSASIRQLLERALAGAGMNVRMTTNGQEALEAARALARQAAAEGRPVNELLDAVVSDIEMPLMDGFTLTKNLKADPALGDLPVILYSSIITAELRHKGESVGADWQVSKPDLERIPEVLIRLVEERARKRQGAADA